MRLELLGGISHQFNLLANSIAFFNKLVRENNICQILPELDNSLLTQTVSNLSALMGLQHLVTAFTFCKSTLSSSFETICSKNTIASNNTHASCICYVIDVLSRSITLFLTEQYKHLYPWSISRYLL